MGATVTDSVPGLGRHDLLLHDGQTAQFVSPLVPIRTRDVAITKFRVPKSGKYGQARDITVGVQSNRYDEDVDVVLWKSVPSGFAYVGQSRQFVPLRNGNKGTEFTFSYTFTAEDAAVGKVNFKAEAILSGRDALPGDNTAVSAPTKVAAPKSAFGASGYLEEFEHIAPEQKLYLPMISGANQ